MKNISEDLELAENAYSEEGADYADSTCQHGDPYDSKPKPESGEVSEIRFCAYTYLSTHTRPD